MITGKDMALFGTILSFPFPVYKYHFLKELKKPPLANHIFLHSSRHIFGEKCSNICIQTHYTILGLCLRHILTFRIIFNKKATKSVAVLVINAFRCLERGVCCLMLLLCFLLSCCWVVYGEIPLPQDEQETECVAHRTLGAVLKSF